MKKIRNILTSLLILFIFIVASNFLTILLYGAYLIAPIVFYILSAVVCFILFAIILSLVADSD